MRKNALHHAAQHNHAEIVKLLLSAGADANLKDGVSIYYFIDYC